MFYEVYKMVMNNLLQNSELVPSIFPIQDLAVWLTMFFYMSIIFLLFYLMYAMVTFFKWW